MQDAPRKQVTVYTDGACSGNPGPGGWGAILMYHGREKELSGFDPATTNNRMEVTAAIRALSALTEPCDVTLYSDSTYLVKAFNDRWLSGWVRRNWKTSSGTPVENRDLWETMLALTERHKVKFVWVKGHASNPGNNRCDEMARGQIEMNAGKRR